MMKQRVVSVKFLPTKLPLNTTIAGWLLLDRLGIPGWGWGVWWTVVVLVWIAAIKIKFFDEEAVEINLGGKEEEQVGRTTI